MKNLILVFFAILIDFGLNAQINERNILMNAYSFSSIKENLIKKNDWHPFPNNSKEWEEAISSNLIEYHIKQADGLKDYLFQSIPATIMLDFVRSGDRLRHSGIHFTKRTNLMTLAIAESMEDKGKYMEQIMNGIWSICEESYWGVPAHVKQTGLPNVEDPYVDLFSAETAACLGIVDYLVGEKLDKINPLIRKRIYAETNERIFNQLLTKSEGYGYLNRKKSVNNWNPWIMSNYLTAALFLENDENKRAKMVYESLYGMDAYLNGLGDDGGCDEGPSYWFAAGACVFDGLDMLYSASKPNLNKIYDEPLIKKMASYIYKTHIGKKFFTNFADADPTVNADGIVLYRFGHAINDSQLKSFGSHLINSIYGDSFPIPGIITTSNHQMRKLQNLLIFEKIEKDSSTYNAPSDIWISDIQLLLNRSDDQKVVFAAHGGHNAESHNHNDVGDFIYYVNNQPIIIDAGRGNYTARTFSDKRYDLWFTQSNFHNLPIINGIGQKAGRNFEAQNTKYTSLKNCVSLEMNLEKAYPEEAEVKYWKRKYTFNKSTSLLQIKDFFELNSFQSLEQIFMTVAEINKLEDGKIQLKDNNTIVNINYDSKIWDFKLEYPSTDGMEYESFNRKWFEKKVKRIILKLNNPSLKGSYEITIIKI